MLRKIATVMMLTSVLLSTIGFTTAGFIALSSNPESSTDWWSMFRHDASRTGCSSFNISSALARFQQYPMTQDKIKSSPALADDAIYACSLDGYAYKYNATPPYSSLRLWQSSNRYGSIYSSPFVTPDTVYFGSDDGHVVALYASNGSERWIYPQIGFPSIGAVRSSPVIVDGILYVGSSDGYLYAVNALTGSESWRYLAASPVESSPAVFGDTIFFGCNDSTVYALSKTSGKIKWFNQIETGGAIVSSPAVADNKVFVGCCDNRLYAFNVSTGKQVWNYTTGGPIVSSPAVSVALGLVFIGSNDRNVTALYTSGGRKWSSTINGNVTSSPAVSADGKVIVGSNDGNMYLLNATTGAYIALYGIGQAIDRSSPAVANGLVAIGSDDHCIYLFGMNRPPVASFVYSPPQPIITQQVTFVSNSSDPDGDYIKAYAWDFGDGTSDSGKIVFHRYSANRPYKVTHTVWDSQSASNSTWQWVNISEAWPMFHHDPKRTGYSTSSAPTYNSLAWPQFQVGPNASNDDFMYPSPIVVGDVVFMSSTKGALYALNASTGDVIWSNTTLPSIHSSPAYVDGSIYVGCDNGYVYVFYATDGGAVRSLALDYPNGIFSSPTVSGDKIFIGSRSGHVYSIDKNSGINISSPQLDGAIDSSPAVANGTVFVGTWNGKVYALDEATLQVVPSWPKVTGGAIVSSPAVADGLVFVGSRSDKVYAFNASTSKLEWMTNDTHDDVDSSPAVAGGVVFVGSKDGNVYALNATTGKTLWSQPVGPIGWSSPAIAEGKVFIGSKDNRIYALDMNNGSVRWSYLTNGSVESSPAVLNDSLYVGSQDGYLYAFHSEMHDVAILNVTAAPTIVGQGRTVNINVTIGNQGASNETDITVTVRYKNITIDSRPLNLTREEQKVLSFSWDTSGVDPGTYTISANATLAVDDDLTNNWMKGDNVTIVSTQHDIRVTNVYTCKKGYPPMLMPVVCQNGSVCVNVTVQNLGNVPETSINVTVYANMTAFASENISLAVGEATTITVNWTTTGFDKGNYTLKAVALLATDEDPGNNEFTDPSVIGVTIIGDVTSNTSGNTFPDGKVDVRDIYAVGRAFGTSIDGPNPPGRTYNGNCDINNDHKVDVKDYYIVCKNYGKVDP